MDNIQENNQGTGRKTKANKPPKTPNKQVKDKG